MGNLLQLDGAGVGNFDTALTIAGSSDFTITGRFTYETNTGFAMILGDNTSSSHYMGCFAGGQVRLVAGSSGTIIFSGGFSAGDWCDFVITRTGTTLSLNINGGTPVTDGGSWNSVRFDILGAWNTDSDKYDGLMDGIWTVTHSSGNRSYDFNQPETVTPPVADGVQIPDTVSSFDITLNDFTSGGFIPSPDPAIAITSHADPAVIMHPSGTKTETIAGTLANFSVAPASIEIRHAGGSWSVLDASPSTTAFTGTYAATGLGPLEVRASDDTDVNISIGDFIVAHRVDLAIGQSNQGGFGDNDQPFHPCRNNLSYMVKDAQGVEPIADPTGDHGSPKGSYFPLIATKYSEAGLIYVVANVAEGSTKIVDWLPGTDNYDSYITDMVAQLGVSNITCFSLNQGESDAGSTPPATYETDLEDLIDNLFTDFGLQTYIIKIIQPSAYSQALGDGIRAAQQNVIDGNANALFGGDLSVITLTDWIHIVLDSEMAEAAEIIFEAQAPRSNLALPNPLGSAVGGLADAASDVDYFVLDYATMTPLLSGKTSWDSTAVVSIDAVGAFAGTDYILGIYDDATDFRTMRKVTAT